MSIDVTSLVIEVKSTGVKEAADAMNKLSEAATKVEDKTKTIKDATNGLSDTQQKSVTAMEKLIAGFQKQVDLLGANTSETNAYLASLKGASQIEQQMAAMLGAEVDAYKAKAAAQAQAIRDNQALDASYKKLQQEVDAFYAAQAKAQAAGNALNAAGQREQELRKIAEAQKELTRQTKELAAADERLKAINQSRDIELRTMSYQKLALAQSEAIAMNKAMDAAAAQRKAIEQARDVEMHAMSYQRLAAAQTEAIKMNNAYDASLRRLAQDEAARRQSVFNGTLQQGHDLARGLSGSLGALWLTYGNIGAMLAGVAIGAALKEAVTGFAKVEYQMTFVKALAEDTTHSVAELTARMHDVAGALGIGPEAAAKGLRALTQAGLNTADALATLPVAFKLATVGELALESAALAATGVMNAYDLKVKDLEHIGDVMAKAGAMSAASVDSISVSMKYSAGTAEQYGVSLEKLGSILTLLGKRGITGSSAGVAANNLIAELYSPSSEKAIKAAAALGVKAYVDGVRQPIEDVVASFKQGLEKYDAQGQGMLLEAYFGKKGGKAFYALAQGTKAEFKELEAQLVNSTGFVADVYKANLQTVQGQLSLTKSAITNMFSKVGEESSAPIRDLLVSIRTMASSQAAQDMFVGLTQSIKTFITVVVPAAVAIGGFFTAAKVGAAVLSAVTVAMGFLESAITIGLIPAIKALNLAMLSNPITLIIGLVATLAAGYMLLKRNKESVHDLHSKDMEQAAETLKAGNEEIAMLEKQLKLRGQNIRGDGEAAAIKEMQAGEAVQRIRQRMMDNNTKYYEKLGQAANASSFHASGPHENVQLQKDLDEAEKTYSELSAQTKKINELKQRVRAEDKRMDAEDLANATPKIVGNLKYDANDKGAKARERDAYMAGIKEQDGIIKASKLAMQNFEDTQNNLFKAGEIGKLKFIQEVGKNQVEELTKQRAAITSQLEDAQGKKNGKADVEKFTAEQTAADKAIATAKLKITEETNVQLAQYAQENTRFQIQELEAQGKWGAAAALKFSSENKLAFKQAEQDLKDFGEQFPEIEDRYIQLQQAAHAAIVNGKNKEALQDFNTEADKVRNILKGVQTATEGQGLAAMFDAARNASAEYAASLPDLQAKMADITDPKGIEEAGSRMRQLAEDQRKTWVGVGESISKSLESAFGQSGKAIGGLIKSYQDFSNLENKSGDARVHAYGNAAAAAKGFFKEGTTGYKVMEGAEKAFRLLELANLAKKLYTSLTVTATTTAAEVAGQGVTTAAVVAGESAKNAAKVPGVFMSFMSMMGPWGMAAAAVAIAAVLGGAFGGGGGADTTAQDRQKTQGTGSVLGMSDAKSESIVNSLAIMEKNSGLGLAQGNQMVNYLRAVADNITSLSSLIVRTTGITGDMAQGSKGTAASIASSPLATLVLGGPIGFALDKLLGGKISSIVGNIANSIFGGKVTMLDTGFTAAKTSVANAAAGGFNANQYTDSKKDGGLFRSDKYSTSLSSLGAEANSQFSGIVANFSGALKEASKALGVDGAAFNSRLDSFIVDIGKISLKGLSGDEIKKQLEAVFSKLGDDMAKFAFTDFQSFQKVGEGFLETIARVANDVLQVKDVFAVLGKTFDITGVSAANVAENLIKASGSLESLTSGTKYFVDNFLTEAEKMGPITDSVRKVMTQLGYSSITSIKDFTALVRSLDLTDPASQALYAALINIAPAFKDAADYADKLAEGTVTLTKAQQKALDAVTKAKSNLQDAYNSESSALQSTIDKTKTFISTLQAYQNSLKIGADSPLTNLQKYAEARNQFNNIASAARAGDATAQGQVTSAAQALLAASKVVNASGSGYTKDFNTVQQVIDDLKGAAGTQVDVAQASLDALNKQVMGLIDVNKSVMSVTDAIKALQSAITLGGIAGLTNTQMDTTYTPTPQQVAQAQAAPASTGARNVMPEEVVAAIKEQIAAIEAQTVAMAAQTGAVIGAVYDSNDENADTIANAVGSRGPKGYAKVAMV